LRCKSFPSHPEFAAAINILLANDAIDSKHILDLGRI
jgi:hypothetical protein